MCIKPNKGDLWFFTMVYANPDVSLKGQLCEDLVGIEAQITSLWLVTGDFNDICEPYEKKGGALFN